MRSPVHIKAWWHEDEVGRLASRHRRGQSRADTELAGLIAGSRHDAPLTCTTHRGGFAAEFRVIALFDRRKERVHVDVNDLALPFSNDRRLAGLVRGLPLSF